MSSESNAVNVSIDLETLKAKQRELTELLKLQKVATVNTEWERKTKARNPALILGSLRVATLEDTATLGHVHGLVCEIACSFGGCEEIRVINKQDAFQVRYCTEHKKEAQKEKMKERRASLKLAGVNPEQLAAEIAKLQAMLSTKQEAVVVSEDEVDETAAA
jgi:hypothetical protein